MEIILNQTCLGFKMKITQIHKKYVLPRGKLSDQSTHSGVKFLGNNNN